MCKDCRWECCLTLFQCQCWTHTHSAVVEVVVHKDELEKDLVEIRCPWNYLGMRNKKYQCNHTLDECRHYPIHACGSPHTEVEQRIWNIWKGTASANTSNRTAVSWRMRLTHCILHTPTSISWLMHCTFLLHRDSFLLKLKGPSGMWVVFFTCIGCKHTWE